MLLNPFTLRISPLLRHSGPAPDYLEDPPKGHQQLQALLEDLLWSLCMELKDPWLLSALLRVILLHGCEHVRLAQVTTALLPAASSNPES